MQRLEVELEDDLTGGPADETVQFSLEGTTYELDLSTQHAADLRRRLAPFVDRARRVHRRGSRTQVRTAASRERSRQIRAWAEQQGLDVAAHGRLPTDVIERYEQAQDDGHAAASRRRRPSSARRPRRLRAGRRPALVNSARCPNRPE
ncbi:MAG TPA: Lsr2 family protein [Streptosporangiaceae bacterium]|nr:Lsr2 family protein [Streptosporangiaceae bacterium]